MSIRENLEKASRDLAKVVNISGKLPDAALSCLMGEEEAWEIRCQMSSVLAYLEDEV
jgi:hypothetical protein